MLKKLFMVFTTACLLLCLPVAAMANYSWKSTALPGLVAFSVPSTLELDERTNNLRANLPGKSLCYHSKDSTHYAFFGIECKLLGEDSGARLGSKPLEDTPADLEAIRIAVLRELSNDPYNNRYFDISNARVIRTNWGEAYFLHYKRQLNNNPAVQIYRYMTFDEDKFYDITISYRIDEFNYWCQEGSDIRQVINTMKFI